jgi:hypothetical protein
MAEGRRGRTGDTGGRGRRGPRGRSSDRWRAVFIGLGAVLLVLTATSSTVTWLQQSNVERNSASIRDLRRVDNQVCVLFERDELAAVVRLRNTYRYLLQLRPGEEDDPINRFVIVNLPVTEAEAKAANAPAYCDRKRDKKDVGLPEPDPKFPKRPRGIP